MDIPALRARRRSVKATASNVYQKQTDDYGPQKAFDNDPQTRWATDSGTKQAWIAADLGKPLTVQRVRIEEAYAGARADSSSSSIATATTWKTIFTGHEDRAVVPAEVRAGDRARVPAEHPRRHRGPTSTKSN